MRSATIWFISHSQNFDCPYSNFMCSMVINKSIAPINPLDPERAHMYIYNNIFFSFAVDSRDLYKDIGGDRLSYAAANNDLQGVNLYNLAVRLTHIRHTDILSF